MFHLLTKMSLNYQIDKDRVYHAMQCHKQNPAYHRINAAYKELYIKLKDLVLPVYFFDIIPKDVVPFQGLLDDFQYLGYSLISIGSSPSDAIHNFFTEDEYLKGLLLDYMCDALLFNYSDQLIAYIGSHLGCDSKGITKTVGPGDDTIPLSYHTWIIERLAQKNVFPYPITFNKSSVISPPKSLTAFYLIQKNTTSISRHQCQQCTENCLFRDHIKDQIDSND